MSKNSNKIVNSSQANNKSSKPTSKSKQQLPSSEDDSEPDNKNEVKPAISSYSRQLPSPHYDSTLNDKNEVKAEIAELKVEIAELKGKINTFELGQRDEFVYTGENYKSWNNQVLELQKKENLLLEQSRQPPPSIGMLYLIILY